MLQNVPPSSSSSNSSKNNSSKKGIKNNKYKRHQQKCSSYKKTTKAIFIYYQRGGRLRRPEPVPDDVFLDELVFYRLEPAAIDEYRRSEGYTTEQIT